MSSHDAKNTTDQAEPPLRFLRMREVADRTGLTVRSVQRLIAAESFPEPVRLHAQAIGFVETEVEEWMTARIAERRTGSRTGK